jgi:bile acid:Na+ symporter, BASS family
VDELLRALVNWGLTGSIFGLKLAQALDITREDLLLARREPWRLLGSLLIVLVLVPVAILLIVVMVRPPHPTEIALAVVAAAPAAPLALSGAVGVGGRMGYVASLQLGVALLAAITTPITLDLLAHALKFEATMSPLVVAKQVAGAMLLPTALGVLLRVGAPDLAKRLHAPLRNLAGVLFLAVILLVISQTYRLLVELDPRSYLAIFLAIAAALATGHLLGRLLGLSGTGDRAALALECAIRNPGLAMLIASVNFPGAQSLHIVVPYLLVSSLTTTLYSRWQTPRKEH